MATKIKLKRKTTPEENQKIDGVHLDQGEPLFDTNTNKLYIGHSDSVNSKDKEVSVEDARHLTETLLSGGVYHNGNFTVLPRIYNAENDANYPLDYQKIYFSSVLSLIAMKYNDRCPGVFVCPCSPDSGTTFIAFVESTSRESQSDGSYAHNVVDETGGAEKTKAYSASTADDPVSYLPRYSYGYVFRSAGATTYVGTWTDYNKQETIFLYKDITKRVGDDSTNASTYGYAVNAVNADAPTGFGKRNVPTEENAWWRKNRTELTNAEVITGWGTPDSAELVFSKTQPGAADDKAVNLSIDGNFYANYDGSIHKVPTYFGVGDTGLKTDSLEKKTPTIFAAEDKVDDSTPYILDSGVYLLPTITYGYTDKSKKFPGKCRELFYYDLLNKIAADYQNADQTLKRGVYIGAMTPDSQQIVILYVYSDAPVDVNYTYDAVTRTGKLPQYSSGLLISLGGNLQEFGTSGENYYFRKGVELETIYANNTSRAISDIFENNTTVVKRATKANYPVGFSGNDGDGDSPWWKKGDLASGEKIANWFSTKRNAQNEEETGHIAFIQTGKTANIATDGWFYGQGEGGNMVPAATGSQTKQSGVVPAQSADTIKIGNDYYSVTLTDTTLKFSKDVGGAS